MLCNECNNNNKDDNKSFVKFLRSVSKCRFHEYIFHQNFKMKDYVNNTTILTVGSFLKIVSPLDKDFA
jgi:hypothetical protein